MTLNAGPEKGQIVDLEFSKEGQQRILIGLQWDPLVPEKLKQYEQSPPKAGKGIIGKVVNYFRESYYSAVRISYGREGSKNTADGNGGKDSERNLDRPGRDEQYGYFDLDLYCFALDKNGALITVIGPENDKVVDRSGKIYHSGENYSGAGGPDDEQIYIELKNLPDPYRGLVFVVTSDSMYSFGEIERPRVRLADSRTNQDLLNVSIEPPKDLNQGAYAYVFAGIFRDNGVWRLKNIGEFADFGVQDDIKACWEQYLGKIA